MPFPAIMAYLANRQPYSNVPLREPGQTLRKGGLRKLTDVLREHQNLNFVQRAMNPTIFPNIPNQDGSVSTHLMSWGGGDGKYSVYPTIVQSKSGKLRKLGDQEAWDYAQGTGEYIPFNNPNDADYFSQHYKDVWNR